MSGTTFSKLPVMIVALVIGLILTFTAVMPLVSDYSDDKTFTNEGLWRMKAFENGDEWKMTSAGVWTYDDNPAITTDNSTSSVIIGEDWTVRGTGAIYGHTVYNATPSTVTVTVGESSTAINSGSVNSIAGYGIDPEGDYIVTAYDKPSYVRGDTLIWATGYSSFDSVSAVFHIEGSIKDGVTVTASTINNTSALSNFAISKLSINSVKTDYVDTYRLDSITFTVDCDYTVGGTTTHKTGNISYSSYVVPYEFTSAADNPTAYKNLVSVIPLFALILLVAGAATLVYFKNKD